MKIYDMFDT